MTRAELCRRRAEVVGWEQACKEFYSTYITARDYAKMLRGHGMPVRDIVTLCRLRFGVGSNAWVLLVTDPEQYQKHLERNKKWAKKRREGR